MKNELDSKFVLRVFEKLQRHGENQIDGHILQGVKGYTDYDGYTLYLEDALVKLNFGFHNQYHFDYEKQSHLEQFLKKLQSIDQSF